MRYTRLLLLIPIAALWTLIPSAGAEPEVQAQELQAADGSDLARQLDARERKIRDLPAEEQELLRAAQKRALDDPSVKAALQARTKAVEEFRAAFTAAMMKTDPDLGIILQKMSSPRARGVADGKNSQEDTPEKYFSVPP